MLVRSHNYNCSPKAIANLFGCAGASARQGNARPLPNAACRAASHSTKQSRCGSATCHTTHCFHSWPPPQSESQASKDNLINYSLSSLKDGKAGTITGF